MIFPDGILVSKEKRTVRTERINTVIFEIARQSGALSHKKTGVNDFEIVYPRLVELKGDSSNFFNDIKALIHGTGKVNHGLAF